MATSILIFLPPPVVFYCGLQCRIFRLLGGEAISLQRHFLGQCLVRRRQVGEGNVNLRRRLCHIYKIYGDLHGVVRSAGNDVPLLAGSLLSFAQVCLRLDEIRLELSPGLS